VLTGNLPGAAHAAQRTVTGDYQTKEALGILDVFTAGVATPLAKGEREAAARAATNAIATTQVLRTADPILSKVPTGLLGRAAPIVGISMIVSDAVEATFDSIADIRKGQYLKAYGRHLMVNPVTSMLVTGAEMADGLIGRVTGVAPLKTVNAQIYNSYSELRDRLSTGDVQVLPTSVEPAPVAKPASPKAGTVPVVPRTP
jgi:hypothetical protein